MIETEIYYDELRKLNIDFFAGVPDSLLKNFCACVTEKSPAESPIISANEGSAVGLGIGYYLATKKLPLIYLQNSGLGNTINPLLSLANEKVYSIPMLLMSGWRGEPGVKDEPQHIHQGQVMIDMLESMKLPYFIIEPDTQIGIDTTKKAISLATKNNSPVFLIVKKNTFTKFTSPKIDSPNLLGREEALKEILKYVPPQSAIVSTTGMLSRELFEHRSDKNEGHHMDFLTVGGMGHANQISLGIAIGQKDRVTFCFDGDGAAIMHLGSLPIVGQSSAKNLVHIIFNNGVHDSVGGQPTVGFDIHFIEIAKASGYSFIQQAKTKLDIKNIFNQIDYKKGPYFLEVQVSPGNREGIGRPTKTPVENKDSFMRYLETKL